LPNALLTYLKNLTIFWHKKQNWTNFIRISIWSEDTGTKETPCNSSKESQQWRDYIQYNKYMHSIGDRNNQSIVPINSWKSSHVRDVVLTRRCGNASKK